MCNVLASACLDNSGAIEFKEFCTKLFKTDLDFNYGTVVDHQVSLNALGMRVRIMFSVCHRGHQPKSE